mgnify:CR=1 FL=1
METTLRFSQQFRAKNRKEEEGETYEIFDVIRRRYVRQARLKW